MLENHFVIDYESLANPGTPHSKPYALTSRHHEANILHGEHGQLLFRIHTDNAIGQPMHGEHTSTWGLVAVICWPVRQSSSEYLGVAEPLA